MRGGKCVCALVERTRTPKREWGIAVKARASASAIGGLGCAGFVAGVSHLRTSHSQKQLGS
jgi:hypothetical protein